MATEKRIITILLLCAIINADLGPYFDPRNNHWYEIVEIPAGISYENAKILASERMYHGYTGYLGTISTAVEFQFVEARFAGRVPPGYTEETIFVGFENNNLRYVFSENTPEAGFVWQDGSVCVAEAHICVRIEDPISGVYGGILSRDSFDTAFELEIGYGTRPYFLVEYNPINYDTESLRYYEFVNSSVTISDIPTEVTMRSSYSTAYTTLAATFDGSFSQRDLDWVVNNNIFGSSDYWLPGFKDTDGNWKWNGSEDVFYTSLGDCLISSCPWFGGSPTTGDYVYVSGDFWYSGEATESHPMFLWYDCDLNCMNEGSIPNDKFCTTCECVNSWTTRDCSVCGLICENGGSPDSTCLNCENCNGNWGGDLCDVCQLSCENGSPSSDCTSCICGDNWEGSTCQTCTLSCENGSPFSDCSSCNCTGNWYGETCNQCSLSCQNGATANDQCTQCDCSQTDFVGSDCSRTDEPHILIQQDNNFTVVMALITLGSVITFHFTIYGSLFLFSRVLICGPPPANSTPQTHNADYYR